MLAADFKIELYVILKNNTSNFISAYDKITIVQIKKLTLHSIEGEKMQ